MSDSKSNADGAGSDPLGPVKALTGPYLRMGRKRISLQQTLLTTD